MNTFLFVLIQYGQRQETGLEKITSGIAGAILLSGVLFVIGRLRKKK